MTTAVFDCVVFVQAAINETGPAFACLLLVEEGHVKLFISSDIITEIRDTLSEHKLGVKFPHLTDERVDVFLQKIARLAGLVQDVPTVYSLPRDPRDEPYVNLAITTQAAYLLSRDKDLLSLRDVPEFRKAYPALSVVDPIEFLRLVRDEIARQVGN